MSRFLVWVLLSLSGLLYWGGFHDFAPAHIDSFAGPVWFGGFALFIHYLMDKRDAAGAKDGQHG